MALHRSTFITREVLSYGFPQQLRTAALRLATSTIFQKKDFSALSSGDLEKIGRMLDTINEARSSPMHQLQSRSGLGITEYTPGSPWTNPGSKKYISKEDMDTNAAPQAPNSHENPSILYDPLAMKFINMLMRDGKKSQASKVFAQALGLIKKAQLAKIAAGNSKVILNPMVIFHQAIENAKPSIATQIMVKGGRSYHVPCSLTANRRTFLSCKWIITSVRQKDRGMGTAKKLAIDILNSYNQQGTAVKKRQDLHRLADVNRAYAHYRW